MLALEDYLDALSWAESIGGLKALQARANANFGVLSNWVAETKWVGFLAADASYRSNTSVCLMITDPRSPRWRKRRATMSSRHWRRSWRPKASPSTSPAIAMPRRDCASGAARRWMSVIWKRDALARLGLGAGQAGLSHFICAQSRGRGSRVRHLSFKRLICPGPDRRPALARRRRHLQERGVEADVITGLSKDELLKIVVNMTASPSARRPRSPPRSSRRRRIESRRSRRHRRRQCRYSGSDSVRRHRDDTPFGNSITTAEHAISLMLAWPASFPPQMPRPRPANGEEPLHGVEITGKVLGLIGAGNIGSIVADRAKG